MQILCVCGTRPNFVKIAAVVAAVNGRAGVHGTSGVENLRREGVGEEHVFLVGKPQIV